MIWNWGIRTEKANLRHHNLYNKIFYKRVQDKSGGKIASKDTWQYRHNDTEESMTKTLNLTEFMMEEMDNSDRCHMGDNVLWGRGSEQRHRERTYLISGDFCDLICEMGE